MLQASPVCIYLLFFLGAHLRHLYWLGKDISLFGSKNRDSDGFVAILETEMGFFKISRIGSKLQSILPMEDETTIVIMHSPYSCIKSDFFAWPKLEFGSSSASGAKLDHFMGTFLENFESTFHRYCGVSNSSSVYLEKQ